MVKTFKLLQNQTVSKLTFQLLSFSVTWLVCF